MSGAKRSYSFYSFAELLILASIIALVSLLYLFLNFSSVALAEQFEIAKPKLVFPLVSDRVSSQFGSRTHPIKKTNRHHSGIDLAAPKGSHVRAVSGGRVVFAASWGGYGKLITVMHDKTYISLYGHLDEILVNVGQEVRAGEVIGRVGSTGRSTGPHLHFEWRKNSVAIDPLEILPGLTANPQG